MIVYASYINLVDYAKGRIMNTVRKQRSDTKDLSGKIFNDLTVIKRVHNSKSRGCFWLCLCVCGKECQVYGGHLRNLSRKSCGCRSESRILNTGINRIFSLYKRKAFVRNRSFSLSKEEFKKIVLSDCNYCGREPSNVLKRLKSKKLQLNYNGIDRFDPTKGYDKDNCVPCCYYCNHAKLDLTFDQWMSHIKKIISYQGISNAV